MLPTGESTSAISHGARPCRPKTWTAETRGRLRQPSVPKRRRSSGQHVGQKLRHLQNGLAASAFACCRVMPMSLRSWSSSCARACRCRERSEHRAHQRRSRGPQNNRWVLASSELPDAAPVHRWVSEGTARSPPQSRLALRGRNESSDRRLKSMGSSSCRYAARLSSRHG
jgi:hypothetical protein